MSELTHGDDEEVRLLTQKGLARCRTCGRLVMGGQHPGCGMLTVAQKQEALRAVVDAKPAMSTGEAGRTLGDLLDARRDRQTERFMDELLKEDDDE